MKTIVEKSKKKSEDQFSKAHKILEEQQSEMATKAKSILSKHDHGFQKSKEEHEKVVEKAKTHVAKVQKTVV